MREHNRAARRSSSGASTPEVALGPVPSFDGACARAAGRSQAVHKIFETVAVEHGSRIAVSYRGREVSYRELDVLANSVARRLKRLSVRPGDIVGVMLPHSIEIVVAFLAILKCGGAYLPLDDANPPQRNTEFMRASNVKVMVGSGEPHAAYRENCAWLLASEFAVEADAVESFDSTCDDRAYVMYTSGSTGMPKGVMVPHRAVARLVTDTNYISIEPGDRILQLAPPSFDASTFEIWGALLNGATLVPYSGKTMDPNRLRDDLRENGVTILWLAAALFSVVADKAVDALASLRVLLAGGDVLNARHVNKVLEHIPGITVINGYGPTENTTFTCCHVMTASNKPAGSVPIGRPITGTRVHVLDDMRRPVAAGVAGELYVSGEGVALGYLNEQHGDVFFADATLAPGLIYRTGDLVKEDLNGDLQFIGRRDSLVKVRGHRVSLEEVRRHIVSMEEIVDAVVVKKDMLSGDQVLVAYARRKEHGSIDARTMRRRLAKAIPGYMIPSQFVIDQALPINENGKIDRAKILLHLNQRSDDIGQKREDSGDHP